MRLKISFITIVAVLILIFQIEILAQTATKSETKILAENLTTKSFFNLIGLKGARIFTVDNLDSIVYDGITIGYFYHYQPSGFALIPKFKEINPFFAFSNNGKLNLNSDNFIASFLTQELILRYRAVKENKLQKETIKKNISEWEGSLVKGLETVYPIQIPAVGTTSTGGLIETIWGQEQIYDDFCPTDPITNVQSVVGCAPLAMSQIVNYWGNLTGTPTSVNFTLADNYTSMFDPGDGNGERVFSIDATTASFSNITYPLSDQNIGRLNFACGVSLKADYSSAGTRAIPLAESFINKFGFQYARDLDYDGNFTDVLYHNIEKGMPSLLVISKIDIGHAIVCDGLIDDGTTIRFHLNYGWYGQYAEPTLFYEIPANLPSDYTTIEYGIVDISKEVGIVDIDGNYYKTVMIGTQRWMAENLKTTKYNDNSAIPLVTDGLLWGALSTPGYCWYNNDEATYKATYGALYNWYTVNTGQLCPAGWHVPSDNEWTVLTTYLGGESIAGDPLKEAGTSHWSSPNTGTNSSGFTALPGGSRFSNSSFLHIGGVGFLWSSTANDVSHSWSRNLENVDAMVYRGSNFMKDGFSVRCIADESMLPTLSTTSISSITTTSAVSVGNITDDGGAPVTARGVCWSTGANPTIALSTKTSDGVGTGIFTSNITGLNANTTYYVRAFATNSAGTAYGNEISFKTYNSDAIQDIESNFYNIVSIGTQVWMTENLKTTKYNDGTGIPLVTLNTDWTGLLTPGYCWYNNDAATYKDTYGALYNWWVVDAASNGGKNACPTGWHVPNAGEMYTLASYYFNESVAGGKLKEAGTTHWNLPNTGATNEDGFTALPGGMRYTGFGDIGNSGWWWISADGSTTYVSYFAMSYNSSLLYIDGFGNKLVGQSVRCLKDNTSVTEDINLTTGWNIMSFAVQPTNMSMLSIVNPMITAATLTKVQDERGNAIEQLPAPIGWVDNIGQMNVSEGYKIKVTGNTILSVTGQPATFPYYIPLEAGWNIIGYPCMYPQPIFPPLEPIIIAGSLLKVQDEAGNAVEKLPEPIGWIDNIINLIPGHGYKAKVSVSTSITINCNGKGGLQNEDPAISRPTHFKLAYAGNGSDQMNIYLKNPTVGGVGLKTGDEIGVFDGGLCVGAVVIDDPTKEYFMAITSLDDPGTKEKDGFTEGNNYELRLWDNQAGLERKAQQIETDKGYNKTFEKLGTSVLAVDFETVTYTSLCDAFPNPSTNNTTFTFQLGKESKVRFEIYNLEGDLIKVLVDRKMAGGRHQIEWDNRSTEGNRASSGVYFYRLKLDNFLQTKQLVIH